MAGYLGDKGVSIPTQELITNNFGWSVFEFYKFSFYNDIDCSVRVNGNTIPLRAGQGFETTRDDEPIRSFIILEAGVSYSFVGAYQ